MLGEVGRLLRTVHSLEVTSLPSEGLLPADDGWSALYDRLQRGFVAVTGELTQRDAWRIPLPPAQVASRALAALPKRSAWAPVVLHSNPGPTHVFVDELGSFTGVIDFGDAYCSHPGMDLRTWPDPADRVALRQAYLDGDRASSDFDPVWTVAMIVMDLNVIARRPELTARAAEDLTLRLADL